MICCFNTKALQKSHWNVIFPMALNLLFSNCLLLSKLLLEPSTYFTITSRNFAIIFCRRFLMPGSEIAALFAHSDKDNPSTNSQ